MTYAPKHESTSPHVDPHFVLLYVRIERQIHQNRLDERTVGRHYVAPDDWTMKHCYDPRHSTGGLSTGRVAMLASLAARRAQASDRGRLVSAGAHRAGE